MFSDRFEMRAARHNGNIVAGTCQARGDQTTDRTGAVNADFHGVILGNPGGHMFGIAKKLKSLLPATSTIPGRAERMHVPAKHFVNGNRLEAPFPSGMQLAQFGIECFHRRIDRRIR